MMQSPELIAQFRYTVIAPLVTRSLQDGEQRALVAQQAAQVWEWPDGHTRGIHARTLLRWVAAYRTGGLAALQPQGDTNRPLRQTNPAVLERAVALRAEDPHRSARMIIQMLEWAQEIEPGSLAYSTLTYHFRKAQAAAYLATPPADTFRRRQAPYLNAEWQGDSQMTRSLPHPNHPDRRKKVYLIAFIDDATRYVVGSRFFFGLCAIPGWKFPVSGKGMMLHVTVHRLETVRHRSGYSSIRRHPRVRDPGDRTPRSRAPTAPKAAVSAYPPPTEREGLLAFSHGWRRFRRKMNGRFAHRSNPILHKSDDRTPGASVDVPTMYCK